MEVRPQTAAAALTLAAVQVRLTLNQDKWTVIIAIWQPVFCLIP